MTKYEIQWLDKIWLSETEFMCKIYQRDYSNVYFKLFGEEYKINRKHGPALTIPGDYGKNSYAWAEYCDHLKFNYRKTGPQVIYANSSRIWRVPGNVSEVKEEMYWNF